MKYSLFAALSMLVVAFNALAAAPLRVAGLFAQSTGKEYICVTKAFQEIAKAEGANIKIDVVEHDNSISDLLQKTNSIVAQKYDIVIGPRTSQEAIATSAILTAAKIPQILPVASYLAPNAATGRLTVTMVPDSERYSALSAKLIMKRIKPKNILVIVNESQPYSTNYADLLPKHLKELGYSGKIGQFEYIEGSADYDKIAAKAKDSKADLIYAPLYGMDIGNLYGALAKANMRTTLFARAFELRDILKRQYSPAVKLIFNGIWDQKMRGPYAAQFQKLLKDSCKDIEVGVRAVTGFDSLRLLLDTIKTNPELRGQELAKAIATKSYSGLMGDRKFDMKSGALLLSMPIFEHNKGGFKIYEVVN